MGLEIIKEINVDFYNTRYISVNAKQYDTGRYISVTCYNQGTLFPIDKIYNHAFIRCRKPDELNVFNYCDIVENGTIFIELTEQMLASVGRCYVDLVIVHNEPISPDSITVNEGTLLTNENTSIVSTMLFCINILGSAMNDEEIESSEEYNALNDLLIKATTDYSYVMAAAKVSEDNAKASENNAKESELNAKVSENNASISEINAKVSEDNAKASENNAKESELNAGISESNASIKADEAAQYASSAFERAEIATNQATLAYDNAMLSKSYAVGDTGLRTDEDTNNSKYYYIQAKAIKDSVDGSFKTMGSINFSELTSVEKQSGYIYHIKDAFVTDDTFKEGAGVSYPEGTNVYYTNDGYWDTLVIGMSLIVSDDDDGNVTLLF